MKFRKKPIIIEAATTWFLINTAARDWKALPDWFVKTYDQGGVVITAEGIHLPTLEGTMFAGIDDVVICGVKGEIYLCKRDIFQATYDRVDT